MKRPKWAKMKVRMYLATCWSSGIEEGPTMVGVNWFNDKLLMACVWFHNWFVQPFFEQVGFPYTILEIHDPDLAREIYGDE